MTLTLDILKRYTLGALIGFVLITWIHEVRTDALLSYHHSPISLSGEYLGPGRRSDLLPEPAGVNQGGKQ